jgi:hypothetical protein
VAGAVTRAFGGAVVSSNIGVGDPVSASAMLEGGGVLVT